VKRVLAIIYTLSIVLYLAGCGETIHGIGKDAGRIKKGASTIIFRER